MRPSPLVRHRFYAATDTAWLVLAVTAVPATRTARPAVVTAAGKFPPAEAADGSAAAKALSLVAIGFAVATASAVDFAVATALAAGFADATEFAVVGTDTTEFAVVGTWLGPIARPAASTPVSHVAVVAVSAVTVVAAVTVVVAAVVT